MPDLKEAFKTAKSIIRSEKQGHAAIVVMAYFHM